MLKKFVLISLAVSGIMLAYLFVWDEIFVYTPIDQSLCPPELGQAPDGTCGLYNSRPSVPFILAGVLAFAGFVALMLDGVRRKQQKSTEL